MSFEASAKSSESKDVSSVDSEKKRNFKIAIVKTGQALEDQARDIAESRMTASKEELRGVKGFFEKIWKHNLAREYYRQREIAKSKAEIQTSKNLFEGEGGAEQYAHAEAMNAVVDRFVQEYEEAIHIDAGEERRKVGIENAEDTRLSTEVRALLKEYASGKIDEEGFNAERSRIIAYATGLTGEQLASAVHHTDNMLEIAKQAKIAVEHGMGIDAIDQEIEIVIGKAKVGVRSEANMNSVDRIVAKMQASKLGRFVNETTIATGVAIAYMATVGISQRLASSRAFAWGTFGASALVGGAIAGMRESVRVEEERSQHSRERAKGEKSVPGSERREEMEQLIYKTETAKNLTESLRNIRDNLQDSAEFQTALSTLAQAESRIQLSDRERVDLISYTDFKSIERERLELDIARAEVKVRLRKIAETTGDVLPKERTFDDFYTLLLNIQESELRGGHEGMEKKDELFKKMKRRKIAGATTKAVLTGLVIGGTVQEVGAFMNSSQVGLAENALGMQGNRPPESVTALEGVRRWFVGEEAFVRPMGRHVLSQNINLELPEGVEITENPQGTGEFTFTKDGEVLSDKIQFDNGVLTPASEEILKNQGVIISQSTARIGGPVEGKTTGQGFIEQNPDLFQKIHRKFWYDNNTSVFDKNELKLHWGGVKGSGVDAQGNYVFDVAKMTPDGSTFKDLSIDAQETMKGGKLKLLLSLSKDSQSSVVEVSIDERGRAIIDPNSEVGKMFFKVEEGKLAFVGKFAEVAHEAGVAQDGGKQFEVLATHVGKGVEEVPMPTQITQDVPVTTFEVTDNAPYVDLPPFLPVFGRKPLEPMESRRLTDITQSYYNSYGGENYGLLDRQKYKERMSKKILENSEIDLSQDDLEIVTEYIDKQDPEYLEELHELVNETTSLNENIETVITIPSYREGKNLEKTLRNYAKMRNREKFEIVILENHPAGTARDNTREVIAGIQSEFPNLNIVHLYKIFDVKPAIGNVRKYLVDSVLLRKKMSHINKSIAIVSNDADLEGISENYANDVSETFKNNRKVDAIGAKWDFSEEDFKRFPLLHASQRLWQYLDIAFRNNYLKSPELIGRNSAFRSGAYAAVGGYNKDAQLAEDLEIGWLIKEARGNNAERITYLNRAWLISNSRRAILKMLSGGMLIQQYGDFHVNEAVRDADPEELLKEKRDFNIEDFSKEVASIYEHYRRWKKSKGGWVDDHYVDDSFDRAMRFLGVIYKKTNADQIEIVDATKLVERLEKYQGTEEKKQNHTDSGYESGNEDESILDKLTKDYLKEKRMIKGGGWDVRQSTVQKVLNEGGYSKGIKVEAEKLLKELKRLEAEYVAGHEKVPVAGDSDFTNDEQKPDPKPEISVEKEMKPNLEKSYSHSLSKTEALSQVKKMLEQARKENARKITNLKEEWVGDKNSFSFNINGQEIKGVIEVKDNEVLIQGELPRVALFFKSAIMKVLDAQAKKVLAK